MRPTLNSKINLNIVSMKLTVTKSINKFLSHCRYEKHLGHLTLKAYECDLRQFQQFIYQTNKSRNIDNIDKDLIVKFIRHIYKFKPKTSKRKIAVIKALFKYLEFDDYIDMNPFRKIRVKIRNQKEIPEVMTIIEIKELLDSSYKRFHLTGLESSYKRFEYSRNLAIIELLFATGVRVSELCNIKMSDIDLTSGALKINGKGSKQRIIQIFPNDPLTRLREYHSIRSLMNHSSFLFLNRQGSQLSPQSVRLMIKAISEITNIAKKIRPHTFRHTFGTLLLEEGVDIKYIQSLLGHSSIVTTQIYTHVTSLHEKKIIMNYHPRRRLQEYHPNNG